MKIITCHNRHILTSRTRLRLFFVCFTYFAVLTHVDRLEILSNITKPLTVWTGRNPLTRVDKSEISTRPGQNDKLTQSYSLPYCFRETKSSTTRHQSPSCNINMIVVCAISSAGQTEGITRYLISERSPPRLIKYGGFEVLSGYGSMAP